MRVKSYIIFVLAFGFSHALDPMYEYRYTFGPEILVPDAFHVGFGAYTHYNEDIKIVSNFQIGLGRELEMGLKYLGGTNDDWIIARSRVERRYRDHNVHMINIGAKYAIGPHLTMQADAPIALNKDREWGGIISITQWDGYTKNVSFLFEGRVGFGGAAGEGSYAKPSLAFFPYFQIGQSFRLSIGTISSFSFGHFKDDFMLDILPRVEVGLRWFRLTGEVAIGILTDDAQIHNKYALFVVKDI